MQLQPTAGEQPHPLVAELAAGQHPPGQSLAVEQLLPNPQSTLQGGPLVPVAGQDVVAADAAMGAELASAAAAEAAAAELSDMQEALSGAETRVAVLVDENERLMELSNGLRAENQGLKQALSLQQVREVKEDMHAWLWRP